MKSYIVYFMVIGIFFQGCSTMDMFKERTTNCEARIDFRCECECDDDSLIYNTAKTVNKIKR